ncbi:MAG: alanine racemase, partial [Xylophilus sp.]|nr:alanine racemase [Xylophilus sp.]
RLRGLMTIPDIAPDFAAQCAVHTGARALFDAVKAGLSAGHAADFDTLSMGMSADLEAAIRCGSTLVRVGTAIFGGRVA